MSHADYERVKMLNYLQEYHDMDPVELRKMTNETLTLYFRDRACETLGQKEYETLSCGDIIDHFIDLWKDKSTDELIDHLEECGDIE